MTRVMKRAARPRISGRPYATTRSTNLSAPVRHENPTPQRHDDDRQAAHGYTKLVQPEQLSSIGKAIVAMSGQLVGEVIDAAEAGLLDALSPSAFGALVAIAEKCHTTTRQGSVRAARIAAAIRIHARDDMRSVSKAAGSRTADRAIRELKDAQLVSVVQRGFKAPNGYSQAPIYELAKFSPSREAETSDDLPPPKEAETSDVASAIGHVASAIGHEASAVQGGVLDGSLGGSIGGGRAREARDDLPPPRYCPKHPHGTPDSCIPCKLADRNRKAWEGDRDAREKARIAREQAEAADRRNATAHCARCNGTGQIDIDDDTVDWCPDCSAWRKAARR